MRYLEKWKEQKPLGQPEGMPQTISCNSFAIGAKGLGAGSELSFSSIVEPLPSRPFRIVFPPAIMRCGGYSMGRRECAQVLDIRNFGVIISH